MPLVTADTILATLRSVEFERRRRSGDPELGRKVAAVKAFQQQRFLHTYADLLTSARYGGAARFFLDELYGPADFTQRDAQFSRVVPSLIRLFPEDVVNAVAALAELHALSETLDTAMASHLDSSGALLTPLRYAAAWQATGCPGDRQLQISLTVSVAGDLDRLTRKPLLRTSLRLMRGPARAAGLAALQQFLEAGFDTFRAMKGATEFVETVRAREEALASLLFRAQLNEPMDAAELREALTRSFSVASDA